MTRVYTIETEDTVLLDNISGMAKNEFVKAVCSDRFALGQGVSVTNKDGESLLVTHNHAFQITSTEAK